MSGHAFRGEGGGGVAFNKVAHAILVFPKVQIKTWMNHGIQFTAGPSDYAGAVKRAMQGKYESLDKYFKNSANTKVKITHDFDRSDFRNREHFRSISEPDGTLHSLCRLFLAGLAADGARDVKQATGIFGKRELHSAPAGMIPGRRLFLHEVQFVVDGRVKCVWKLEASGVRHGAEHSDNLKAAISESSQTFNRICRLGQAAG